MLQIKFAFNKSKKHNNKKSSIEVIYGFNPHSVQHLALISYQERFSSNKVEKIVEHLKSIHEQVHMQI